MLRLFVRMLKLVLIAVAALGIAGLCVACVALARAEPQAAMLVFVLLILLSVGLFGWWAIASATRRRSRSAAVIGYLEQAVRLNLPLPRMINALAESEPDRRFARDLNAARETLERGGPIATVLGALPDVPQRIVGLVATAEHTGRLPQVLSRITRQRKESLLRGGLGVPLYRTYPLLLAVVFVVITSMFAVFVAPRFRLILRDFGQPLPWVTMITLRACEFVGPWVVVALIVLLTACAYLSLITRSRGAGFGLVERPLDWIANRLPWIGQIRMQRALGDVMEVCAGAVESGRALDNSLLEAAQLPANSRLRHALEDWSMRLSQGEPIEHACRAAAMPPLVCGMVATGVHTADLASVLRFLARYYSTRFSRASELLGAAIVPLLAMGMGLMVGWLALSVFLPLVRLIDRIAPYPPMGL